MHKNYWESLLELDVERQKLSRQLEEVTVRRNEAWEKVRMGLIRYGKKYYFHDLQTKINGGRLFIVTVDGKGELVNIVTDHLGEVNLVNDAD